MPPQKGTGRLSHLSRGGPGWRQGCDQQRCSRCEQQKSLRQECEFRILLRASPPSPSMGTYFSIYRGGKGDGKSRRRALLKVVGSTCNGQHPALAAKATCGFLATRLLVGEDQQECAEENHRRAGGGTCKSHTN